MNLVYYFIKKLTEVVQLIYFRKVYIVGLQNIPKEGPVIICGNHANQFVDAMMISASVERQLSFTMAASSFSKKLVGFLARCINAIPVKRPEDSKKKGEGKIKLISLTKIVGENTKFKDINKNFGEGWSIMAGQQVLHVKKIISDTEVEIAENKENEPYLNEEYNFYVSLTKSYIIR